MHRRKFIKLTILLFIITFTTSGCDKTSSEDIAKITSSDEHNLINQYSSFNSDNALNEARINLIAGNVEDATYMLEKFVTYRPNNSMGHYYLSKAYYEGNNLKKSLYHLKRAFVLDSDLASEQAGPVLGKGIIGRVFATNRLIKEKNLALKPGVWFDKDTQIIYASLETINAPANTEIETEWVYELSKQEQITVSNIKYNTEGSKNTLLSVEKPASGWLIGKYTINVFVNNQKNTEITFYIL